MHRVEWTSEKVRQFWDLMSRNKTADEMYFSEMVGDSLIRHVRLAGLSLQGRVLDFGCGPGFLMERLLRGGIVCAGVDYSSASVEAARQRLGQFEGFRGVSPISEIPTALDSRSFDVIFFVETIEHLLEEDLRSTLGELRRLLVPGGYVVVTTPNNENIDAETVLCPDCGALFHRMQHLRSFSSDSLAVLMKSTGFRTVKSKPVYLSQNTWQSRVKSLAFRILRQRLPHLLCIAQRPA